MSKPRPCTISSHQLWLPDQICHVITDKGIALVESPDGHVNRYDLTSCYSIKFDDREAA